MIPQLTAPVLPGLFGALICLGLFLVVWGYVPRPEGVRTGAARTSPLTRISRRTGLLVGAGLGGGVVVWLITHWVLAVVIAPIAVLGLPTLLSAAPAKARIARLEALEEWTRSLSGVLVAGVGLEQALVSTLRSAPAAIEPQLRLLTARLNARWSTETALRAFADDLDDATGDLVAANLILAARRRGAGLATVLASLADSVAADVRARRQIEADRAKPRATARWVTLISAGVLLVLTFSGQYVQPFSTPLGQIVLALLLAAYVATLVWLKRMSNGEEVPRVMGAAARGAR
ncbi:type II secretion system F family protein [Xylanimonas ulmi]|uniref:Flp pilus assembly protein TadB n=1 Tax=Xylanimonas ulmi TaxID=228973 RepID=A0A4Q7M3Y6_9MICO|nr:type II secretion system F family protein [Xylanibacterium ulmi]RZS60679.1 Flp pilus assembly protein TadB [Xylanibacterium ulmi]